MNAPKLKPLQYEKPAQGLADTMGKLGAWIQLIICAAVVFVCVRFIFGKLEGSAWDVIKAVGRASLRGLRQLLFGG